MLSEASPPLRAAPDQLEEHIFQRRLVLLQGQDAPVMRGERAHDRADGRFVFQDELQVVGCAACVRSRRSREPRLARCPTLSMLLLGNTGGRISKTGCFCSSTLQVGGRVAGQHFAMVDDGDAIAQLVGLGHVVRREQHRAVGVLAASIDA